MTHLEKDMLHCSIFLLCEEVMPTFCTNQSQSAVQSDKLSPEF